MQLIPAPFPHTHQNSTDGGFSRPFSNPFTDQTILELELESAETAILEVTDLMGRLVFSEQKELPTGTYRWEIPASAVATGGFSIWRVRVGGQMVSGKLARQ